MKLWFIIIGLLSFSSHSFEKKCAFNSQEQQVCVFDMVYLNTDPLNTAVPYSTVIDLFEKDGLLMAKVSKPLVTGPTHAPKKSKILIVPLDDLVFN